ncbi:Neurotensin receptor type 1 [Holothuria leucospilota]|uniref:Neurotensin receptor type 1 n=1 Tax=Holothuria leucospilota TaxID=206669 RepID=A0A9Q0YS96_HOLLE|nr:Neurotensin receptor type 1 [Holothuria leucospilota]
MFTARRTLAVCVATWIISIAACIPALESIVYSECSSPDGIGLKPTCGAYVSSEGEEMYILLLNVCFFAVPCAFLSGIYFIIGRTLRSHDMLMASVSYQGASRTNSDANSEEEEETVRSKFLKIFSCAPCIKTNSKYDQGSTMQYFPIANPKRPLERNCANGNLSVESQVDGCGYIEVTIASRPPKRKQDQSNTDLPPIKEEEDECYSLQTHSLRLERTVKPIRQTPSPQSTLRSAARHRSHSMLIVMLGTVVVVFFVCWLPLRVIALWQIFVSDTAFSQVNLHVLMVFILCSRLLVYINSSINPLLYNLISTKFRRAFKSTVKCHEMTNKSTYSKPPSSSSAGCSGRTK